MTNIVREFDTPIDKKITTRNATVQDSKVLVEDSVEHQAGEGLTAGMSPSMETPDIFDNRPQAVVENQLNENTLVNAQPVDVIATTDAKVTTSHPQAVAVTADDLGTLMQGENDIVPALNTLPDGSVDIPRDN